MIHHCSQTKFTIIGLFVLLSSGMLCAQTPSWVDFDSRKQQYPNAFWLTGFSISTLNKDKPVDEQLRTLTEIAKSELVESINVNISSTTSLHSEQTNNHFKQYFTQATLVKASADLTGLKTETWEDKKAKLLYAFAYIRKADLCNYNIARLKEKYSRVDALLSQAEQERKSGHNSAALQTYRDCLPLLREMEQRAKVIMALSQETLSVDIMSLETRMRTGIEEVAHLRASSASEAAALLADGLIAGLTDKNIRIQVFPFTYQDSKMAGEFSSALLTALKLKISAQGLNVTEPTASVSTFARLTGVYWVENNQVRLAATIYNNNGEILSSSEALLSKDWFTTNQISWLPEQFEEAGKRLKTFAEGEIVGGGLNMELWTNKGTDNLLFHENDTLNLYVRANHECYLRFIYYMADGSKILLMNDYYIGSTQVNKVVQIPETFICATPFGNESLVLNGQTQPFNKLSTSIHDGYTFINEEVQTIVAQSRGFKRVDNQSMNGEKRLVINTVK